MKKTKSNKATIIAVLLYIITFIPFFMPNDWKYVNYTEYSKCLQNKSIYNPSWEFFATLSTFFMILVFGCSLFGFVSEIVFEKE